MGPLMADFVAKVIDDLAEADSVAVMRFAVEASDDGATRNIADQGRLGVHAG
jgi:hypothetical protein